MVCSVCLVWTIRRWGPYIELDQMATLSKHTYATVLAAVTRAPHTLVTVGVLVVLGIYIAAAKWLLKIEPPATYSCHQLCMQCPTSCPLKCSLVPFAHINNMLMHCPWQ